MNEYFASTLAAVLEETSTNMGTAMVLNHLAKHGTVTLEEASFYHNLVADVITESAEDFIPDEVEVPDAPEAGEDMGSEEDPIELYDAEGNKYYFHDGELIPASEVDGDGDGDGDGYDLGLAPDNATDEDYTDSDDAPNADDKAPGQVTESTVVTTAKLLEESDSVVARILANIKK